MNAALQCEAATRRQMRSVGRRLSLLALPALATLLAACDDNGWYEPCEDFSQLVTASIAVGESEVSRVPFCEPWDDPAASYTAESHDTTVVTAELNGHEITLTAMSPGYTLVDVWADLPGRVERGFLFYEVDVFVPMSARSSSGQPRSLPFRQVRSRKPSA